MKFFNKIFSLLIVFFFFHGSGVCAETASEIDPEDPVTALSLIITDQPTIDYRDPKINQALNHCESVACVLYKAIFEYKNKNSFSDKTIKDLMEIKEGCWGIYLTYSTEDDIKKLNDTEIAENISNLSCEGGLDLPLWLVLAYPQITDRSYNLCGISIKSSYLLQKDLEESALTLRNSLYHIVGPLKEFRRAIYMHTFSSDFLERIRIIPQLEVDKAADKEECGFAPVFTDLLEELKIWSFEGVWNRRSYKEFLTAFSKFKETLKAYYRQNESLKEFEKYSDGFAEQYIWLNGIWPNGFSDCIFAGPSAAYEVFGVADKPLEDLRHQTTQFTQEDWNKALCIAILNGYQMPVLEWIIASGADVNSIVDYETPLMKAVDRPEVMAMLIDKGAEVNATTLYGKSALFYAIQYGDIEAVRVLLEKNVDVNQALLSVQEIRASGYDQADDGFLKIKTVGNFTPLIYTLKYGSEEVIKLLFAKGAKLGTVNVDKVKHWLGVYSEMSEEEVQRRLQMIKDI